MPERSELPRLSDRVGPLRIARAATSTVVHVDRSCWRAREGRFSRALQSGSTQSSQRLFQQLLAFFLVVLFLAAYELIGVPQLSHEVIERDRASRFQLRNLIVDDVAIVRA